MGRYSDLRIQILLSEIQIFKSQYSEYIKWYLDKLKIMRMSKKSKNVKKKTDKWHIKTELEKTKLSENRNEDNVDKTKCNWEHKPQMLDKLL